MPNTVKNILHWFDWSLVESRCASVFNCQHTTGWKRMKLIISCLFHFTHILICVISCAFWASLDGPWPLHTNSTASPSFPSPEIQLWSCSDQFVEQDLATNKTALRTRFSTAFFCYLLCYKVSQKCSLPFIYSYSIMLKSDTEKYPIYFFNINCNREQLVSCKQKVLMKRGRSTL